MLPLIKRGFTTFSSHERGFTLIELLIVISIIAFLGVVAFVNFKDLTQDQVINKAIGEIQTALRLAQSNATTSLLCRGQASVDWMVRINSDNVELFCGDSISPPIQTSALQSVVVNPVEGSACTSGSTHSLPLTITYSRLSGSVKIDALDNCIDNSSTVKVKVSNTKEGYTDNNKTFTISKGGAINVE